MTEQTNAMISDFSGKPRTDSFYSSIDEFVLGLGPVVKTIKAQVSYRVNRKFLWLWAYQKTADGTLYLNVTLDRPESDARVHRVTQVSANRWNHHVEVKSADTAESGWLRLLLREGYEFAAR